MSAAHLPSRIAVAMLVAVVVFLSVMAIGLHLIRQNMNAREAERSVALVDLQVAGLRSGLTALHGDYNRWTASWSAIVARDWTWVYENYSETADSGESLDGVILFGGPLDSPVAWWRGQGAAPQTSFLTETELATLAQAVDRTVAAGGKVHETVMRNGDAIFMVVAGHVRPSTEEELDALALADLPFSVFVRVLSPDLLDIVAQDLGLTNLRIAHDAPSVTTQLELTRSENGTPSALVWDAARPGDDMIMALSPVLGFIMVSFLTLTTLAALIARASAQALVQQQRAAWADARIDHLTGLPNRLALHERLEDLVGHPAGTVAVIYLDLNGFKRTNDALGHDAGDAVLCAFAGRLAALAAPWCMAARIAGDEFAMLCRSTPGQSADDFWADCCALADRIDQAGRTPVQVKGHTLLITAAQGLAQSDDATPPGPDLLHRADLAMYSGKSRQQTAAVQYAAPLDQAARAELHIEQVLRRALETRQEFCVHYQPIVDARTGALVQVEALARWTSSELGPVGPDRFIPIAEQAGLIADLGCHLLIMIAADLAGEDDLRVSVNVSPMQLLRPDFQGELLAVLQDAGLSPDRVEVELTEGLLVSNPDLAAFRLDALREHGFSTALDDFGTGYSAISTLRRMPFDRLKIDRSFLIPGRNETSLNGALIESVVTLGHAMGKSVICEGVETREQAGLLARIGCDLLQGHLFGAPMPLADLRRAYPRGTQASG